MFTSLTLGLSGQCDVVEFHRDDRGVPLHGYEGTWLPYPVEYKRGHAKQDSCDELQLCAQAMCLEEMLCCEISDGALFTARRAAVCACTVHAGAARRGAHRTPHRCTTCYRRGRTPQVKPTKSLQCLLAQGSVPAAPVPDAARCRPICAPTWRTHHEKTAQHAVCHHGGRLPESRRGKYHRQPRPA
ncbi:MAG: hypothetical protein ACLUN5_13625 [Oscillospiraceae bacterium]